MGQRQHQDTKTLIAAGAAVGVQGSMLVDDFRHIILALHAITDSNLTVQVQGSIQHEQPDWGTNASPSNSWDYIKIRDLEDTSTLDGDDGVAFTNADNRMFEVNTNALRWINVRITARSAGAVTVLAKPYSN